MTIPANPYFTVIIPTYNRPQLLAEAIQSVQQQSFSDWQLIVVDDAGPMPASVPDDNRIILLRNPNNIGASASFNRGLEIASGRVMAFLADDDRFARSRLASAFVEHELGADLVLCRTAPLQASAVPDLSPPTDEFLQSPIRGRTDKKFGQCGPHVGPMGAISIVAELCPKLDESFPAAEDLEWMVRVCQERPRVTTTSDIGFLWRRHDGLRHGNGVDARILGYHMLLEKHADHFKVHRQEHAFRLRGLGLLYYGTGNRIKAFRCAARSLLVAPSWNACELACRTFLPQSWNWSSLAQFGSETLARVRPAFRS